MKPTTLLPLILSLFASIATAAPTTPTGQSCSTEVLQSTKKSLNNILAACSTSTLNTPENPYACACTHFVEPAKEALSACGLVESQHAETLQAASAFCEGTLRPAEKKETRADLETREYCNNKELFFACYGLCTSGCGRNPGGCDYRCHEKCVEYC
ncbi:hypothetical protein HDV05_005003 [Chytridiales sp. JEL 0842]|nr:hypothetical protein HDV05_005003 [Chytridiales sp. JEL 0842]